MKNKNQGQQSTYKLSKLVIIGLTKLPKLVVMRVLIEIMIQYISTTFYFNKFLKIYILCI